MRLSLLIFILTTISWTLFGQTNDTWTAFWNKDTTLIGFKDKKRNIKIEPKFMGITSANKFDCIIAVTIPLNENWKRILFSIPVLFMGKESTNGIFVSSSPTLNKVTGKYFIKKEPIELHFEKGYKQKLQEQTEQLLAKI